MRFHPLDVFVETTAAVERLNMNSGGCDDDDDDDDSHAKLDYGRTHVHMFMFVSVLVVCRKKNWEILRYSVEHEEDEEEDDDDDDPHICHTFCEDIMTAKTEW